LTKPTETVSNVNRRSAQARDRLTKPTETVSNVNRSDPAGRVGWSGPDDR